MELDSSTLRDFIKATNKTEEKVESAPLYGTVKKQSDGIYVSIDGQGTLTPVSMATDAKDGDRVLVTIEDHEARIAANYTSPASGRGATDLYEEKVDSYGNLIVSGELHVAKQYVDSLVAKEITTDKINASVGYIDELHAKDITADSIKADSATIGNLKADNVTINGKLTAAEGKITNLESDTVTVNNKLTANEADISKLKTDKLDAASADIKYAQIDFANIGEAAIKNLFSESGIIGDLVMKDGAVTGTLVGVTIKGDLIEGGTVVADKLVIKGTDGLYYKLNTNGEKVDSEQTEYNSLNGSIITAKSVTAEKVNVSDLVAFDATIGGINIGNTKMYSGVKSSIDNTTNGFYLDSDGQVAIGNADNHILLFKDSNGEYILDISADNLNFGSGESVYEAVREAQSKADAAQDSVGNLAIGGRNLLKSEWVESYSTDTVSQTLSKTKYILDGSLTYTRTAVKNYGFYINNIDAVNGNTEYIVHFKARCTSGSITQIYIYNGLNHVKTAIYADGAKLGTFNAYLPLTVGSDWVYFEYRFTTAATPAKTGNYVGDILQFNKSLETAFTVELTDLKFEKGNKATDWSPAPEDTQTQIDGVQATANEANNLSTLYATCSTAQTTAAKVATLSSGSMKLKKGVSVSVKFTYANTAASPTLNVNSTGAKAIYTNGVRYAYWSANSTVVFTYDGTYWQVASTPVYANTATVGNSSSKNVYIDGTSVNVRNGTTKLASFGDTTTIGPTTGRNIYIDSDSVDFRNKTDILAAIGTYTSETGYSGVGIKGSDLVRVEGYVERSDSSDSLYTRANGNLMLINDYNSEAYATSTSSLVAQTSDKASSTSKTLTYYEAAINLISGVKKGGSTGYSTCEVYANEIYLSKPAAWRSAMEMEWKSGQSMSIAWWGAGFVTSSSKKVFFTIPLAKPISSNVSSVTAASVNGFVVRQNNAYCYGSAASTYAKPTSYAATIDGARQCVKIEATFTSTTNVTNNSPIGITWSGKLTFS